MFTTIKRNSISMNQHSNQNIQIIFPKAEHVFQEDEESIAEEDYFHEYIVKSEENEEKEEKEYIFNSDKSNVNQSFLEIDFYSTITSHSPFQIIDPPRDMGDPLQYTFLQFNSSIEIQSNDD